MDVRAFITVAISLMGIMADTWSQQKRLTHIETSLEAQKEEIAFIKALIENPKLHRETSPTQRRSVSNTCQNIKIYYEPRTSKSYITM